METAAMLDELQRKANQDSDIKKALLKTREQKNPVAAFPENARNWDIRSMKWI